MMPTSNRDNTAKKIAISQFFVINVTAFLVICFSLLSNMCISQAGIYTESDIEFQSLFIEAQFEKLQGNFDKQVTLLKEVIKRDKSAHAAYYQLSKAYLLNEDYVQAEKNAKKATQFDPNNIWYDLLLAEVYENSLQNNKAAEVYARLLEKDNHNEVLFHNLAYNQLASGNAVEAILTLENLQRLKGVDEETSRRIFDIHYKSGNFQEAVKTMENLSINFPDNIQILTNLAVLYKEFKQEKKSFETYKKILEIDPHNAIATIEVAKKNVKQTGDSNSTAILSDLVENSNIPLDIKIQQFIPFVSNMTKDGPQNPLLINLSQRLVELYPTDAKSFALQGDILFYSGDFKASESSYQKAISLDDTKFTLWDQWMFSLWELEDYKKLQEVSYDAIEYFPNQVNAFIFGAVAAVKNNNIADAHESLEEAVLISANNEKYSHALNVVSIWINLSQLNEEKIKKQLVGIDEEFLNNAIFYEFLGDIHKHLSDPVKSKGYWKLAIGFGANEGRLHKKMGV